MGSSLHLFNDLFKLFCLKALGYRHEVEIFWWLTSVTPVIVILCSTL